MLPLDDATLAAIEASESIDPNKIDTAWTKQRWWQGQVDARMEAHFKLNAPERLRALQALNAAHRATDISSSVGAEDGPIRKVLERQALCKRSGWSFSPLAMETIGVWGG